MKVLTLLLILGSHLIVAGQTRFKTESALLNESAAAVDLASKNDAFRETISRAHAVAVFPKVRQRPNLFSLITSGPGFMIARNGDRWTWPATFSIYHHNYIGIYTGRHTHAVIVAILKKEAMPDCRYGMMHLDSKNVIAGPLTLDDESRRAIADATIVAWAIEDGAIKSLPPKRDKWSGYSVYATESFNKKAYKMKSCELLQGGAPVDPPAGFEGLAKALARLR